MELFLVSFLLVMLFSTPVYVFVPSLSVSFVTTRTGFLKFIYCFIVIKNLVAALFLYIFSDIITISYFKIVLFYGTDLLLISAYFLKYKVYSRFNNFTYLYLGVICLYGLWGVLNSDVLSTISYMRIYISAMLFFIIGRYFVSLENLDEIMKISLLMLACFIVAEILIVKLDYDHIFNPFKVLKYFKNDDVTELTLHGEMTSFINGQWFTRLIGPFLHPTSYGYFYSFCFTGLLAGRYRFKQVIVQRLIIVSLLIGSFWISKGTLALCLFIFSAGILFKFFKRFGVFFLSIIYVLLLVFVALQGGTSGMFHLAGLLGGLENLISAPLGGGIGPFGNLSRVSNGPLTGNESAVGVGLSSFGVLYLFFYLYIVGSLFRLLGKHYERFRFHLFFILGAMLNMLLQEEAFSVATTFYLFVSLGVVKSHVEKG